MLDDSQLNLSEMKLAFESAGLYAGLGDYRPVHGRFEVSLS